MNTETPPTVTPDALTQILHARADRALRAEITAAIAPLDIGQWGSVPLDVSRRLTDQVSKGNFWIPNLVSILKESIISAKTEAARAAEVAAFLAKVENTAAELDAIREEMQG